MSRMIRKQVYVEATQDSRLKKMARDLGVSEAELIRLGITCYLERPADLPRDHTVWQKEKAFIQQWMKKGKVKGTRRWKRNDAYEA
ncbi:MAG: CopG family transcriptional regulator [Pseudomonadota bacterium]